MSARKKSRRLVIDILVPNERGDRITITGSDKTVVAEVLDRWEATCEELMAVLAARLSTAQHGSRE